MMRAGVNLLTLELCRSCGTISCEYLVSCDAKRWRLYNNQLCNTICTRGREKTSRVYMDEYAKCTLQQKSGSCNDLIPFIVYLYPSQLTSDPPHSGMNDSFSV
jgi:hypothetical protein